MLFRGNGVPVPPYDHVALEHTIRRLLNENKLFKQTRETAFRKISQHSFDNMLDDYILIYTETLESQTQQIKLIKRYHSLDSKIVFS